ncbi:hypothetical protein EDB19DRAFT_1906266 [Suillus lakei]|nr:hypothetical protein EDB19DRAFT_1906266 [Suillus lakei]
MSATSVGFQTTQYFTIGAMAVAIFDYSLTISQEVQLIWGRRWDVTRVTFTLARYVTLIGAAMTTFAAVADRSKYTSCLTFNNVSYGEQRYDRLEFSKVGLMAFFIVLNPHAYHFYPVGLLIFRTFAFWHKNRKLLVWLLILAVICIVGAVGVTKAVNILHPAPPTVFASGKSSATQYGFLILYELAVLMILTIYKRLHFYRGARSRLVTTLYRDGMIYMACIIMASIANICVALVVPGAFTNIMDAPQLVIHGVLASRILFNLRQSRQSDSVIVDGIFPLTDMRRAPDVGETTTSDSALVSVQDDISAKYLCE